MSSLHSRPSLSLKLFMKTRAATALQQSFCATTFVVFVLSRSVLTTRCGGQRIKRVEAQIFLISSLLIVQLPIKSSKVQAGFT